jgi:CubicO group peptidase (beta-lactamase class C family)
MRPLSDGFDSAAVSSNYSKALEDVRNMTIIHLPRSTPEAQGISSLAIKNFVEAIEESKQELHSLMLLRHGQVIAEGWWAPYAAHLKHKLFSLSKSFTSTAIGLAVKEGLLSLDDLVISFFPEDMPSEVSPHSASDANPSFTHDGYWTHRGYDGFTPQDTRRQLG